MKSKINIKESFQVFKEIVKDKDTQVEFGVIGFVVIGIGAGLYTIYQAASALASPLGEGKNGKRATHGKNALIGGGVAVISIVGMAVVEKKLGK